MDAELLVEKDVNPAAAAAAALAADDDDDGDAIDAVADGTDPGNITPPTDVLLAAGPPATTPPARTCTVTGSGPDVRTAR